MKILVINCGSSSLKYQLIDMDGEKVLCKGLCERIGMESSMITHEANGHKATTPAIFPTHTEAFAEVVKKMTTGEGKCIDDVSEISAIGHRVVHGGEKFKASAHCDSEYFAAELCLHWQYFCAGTDQLLWFLCDCRLLSGD